MRYVNLKIPEQHQIKLIKSGKAAIERLIGTDGSKTSKALTDDIPPVTTTN